MKILLVIPNYKTSVKFGTALYPYPMGAVSIASYIRSNGFNGVDIKDFTIPPNVIQIPPPLSFKVKGRYCKPYFNYGYVDSEVKDWFGKNLHHYDVVGISSMQSPMYDCSYNIIKMVKEVDGNVPVVLGGAHATVLTEHCTKYSGADYIVRGEGEKPFLRLLDLLDSNKNVDKGVFNKDVEFIEELDSLPYPAWDLVDLNKYPKFNGRKRADIVTARGCPRKCTFCAVKTVWGCTYRCNTPEYVANELEYLIKMGIKHVMILDDNFTLDVDRAIKVCDMILERGLHKKLSLMFREGLEVTIASHNLKLIKKLCEVGFLDMRVGVESFNKNVIKDMKKPFNVMDIDTALNNFKRCNYIPKVFLVMGYPNDTVEGNLETLVKLSKHRVHVRCQNFRVFPKTEAHGMLVEQGYMDGNYDWRLGQYYSPNTKNFEYKDVRELVALSKGIELNGVLDVDPFNMSLVEISTTLSKKGVMLNHNGGTITFTGKFKHYKVRNPVKKMGVILGLRSGYNYPITQVNNNTITIRNSRKRCSKVIQCLKQLIKSNGLLFKGKHNKQNLDIG